ncbi:hypothetical protein FRX31_020690 [Thalictrum thalictroides]|uniref:TF-B3 domain-containing protein n=1 Tax=Thalictrum thalictroides TaxID=46969 RepID=A0A7J6VY02_THATH|nr:hypothetical protein FRX31_020690 [Thalictrum thalictroides]
MAKVMNKDQSRQPYFVKGMIGDFRNKLRIPMTFIKDFKGNVPKQFKLRSLIGRSWIVSVKQVDDDFFLCNEWKDFARDNALEFGEYIICIQNGNSDFTVKICSKSSCNKEVSLAKKNNVESSTCLKEGKEHMETAKIDMLPPQMLLKCDTRNYKESVSSTSCDPDTQIVNTERSKTLTEGDSFTTTLLVSNMYRMGIPRWLAMKGFMEKDSTTLLNLCGKSWTVKVAHEKDGRTCLAAGWREFIKANDFHINDTCCFEVIKDMDNAIRVEILKKGVKEPLEKQASAAMKPSTYRSKEVNEASRVKRKKENVTNRGLSYIDHLRSEQAAGQLRVGETISTKASTSDYPSCSVSLLPSYVYGSSYLDVPMPFARTYLKDAHSVMLRTPNGGFYRIRYREPCRLGKGWKGFVSANHLKEGDVCKFELVDSYHMELLVTISPAKT